jgi:subtilisin family serine protease
MKRFMRHSAWLAALLLAACGGNSDMQTTAKGVAESKMAASLPGIDKLRVDGGGGAVLDARLSKAKGSVEVWVTLSEPSLAAFKAARLAEQGFEMQSRSKPSSPAEKAGADSLKTKMLSQRELLRAKQNDLMAQAKGMGAQELARVHVAHNAIAMKVNASSLAALAALPGVVKVRPVIHYDMDLSETVPYIGASAAQAMGKDGTGVRVAVIDSGIDYTHRNLGGAGTAEAYAAAYGADPTDPKNTTLDGLFPTAKVVGGYDFVGDSWTPTSGTRTEDPDPIDYQGHGTHVADIIAGLSADGTHKGVAPGASLIAIKVCSSLSSSCNGIALLKAMDYALDPNGDGDTSDAVDVINMSLGSAYGQQEDDLSQASANAVKLGVVVVTAAGNNGNLPYVVSSPSIAQGVISVAQTMVPSAKAYPLTVNSPAGIAGSYGNTATLDWAPVGAGFTGNVAVVGRGCPAGSGVSVDDPYTSNPSGKIALIDRGTCSVSLKVDRAARAGATGVIIGLVAAGDAVSFSNGGGSMFVPAVVIQQSLSNAIKANAAAPVSVTLSASGLPIVGSMASTSARGPSINWSSIKPEIGAPGASVSAIAGGGTAESAFGGTSGATPMVAGSAAILIQAFPKLSPLQIKALLMNSAETQIYNNQALFPGVLAPITRIGAGEVRVDRALALSSSAREKSSASSALSFGFQNVTGMTTVTKTLLVENYAKTDKTYSVTPSFRYANDMANGAVTVVTPGSVNVPAKGKATIDVQLVIDGSKLPAWGLNGGQLGGTGSLLEGNEFDGYVTLMAGAEKLSVPWHVLPRASSSMSVNSTSITAGDTLQLSNSGVADGLFEVFALTGVSGKIGKASLPNPGDNFAVVDLRAVGVRSASGVLQFGISTNGRRATPNYPGMIEIDIDVNRDGNTDFAVYTAEQGTFGSTGVNLVYVYKFSTGTTTAYYYTDADLQSGNVILSVPMSVLGITDATQIDFKVVAIDTYFTGAVTDFIDTMTYTPGTPRFATVGGVLGGLVSSGGSTNLATAAVPDGKLASPSQKGLLLLYRREAGLEGDVIRMK